MLSQLPYQGVVTPEAVVLELETAGVGSRTAAALIDVVVRTAASVAFYLALFAFYSVAGGNGPYWLGVTILILSMFMLTVGYSVVFETFWNGRTPGKAALGLRVVTTEGGPIRFRHAAIRGAVGVIEIALFSGGIAGLVIALSKRHQRLGDMAAGTLVLRERSAARMPEAIMFDPPPWAQEYAATLDVSTLSNDQYIAVRSFLVRAASLHGDARVALAGHLARRIATHLRVAPPEWLAADVFLVCVAAAYQRRFRTH